MGVPDHKGKGDLGVKHPAKTCTCLLTTHQGQHRPAISSLTELFRSLVISLDIDSHFYSRLGCKQSAWKQTSGAVFSTESLNQH